MKRKKKPKRPECTNSINNTKKITKTNMGEAKKKGRKHKQKKQTNNQKTNLETNGSNNINKQKVMGYHYTIRKILRNVLAMSGR